MRRELKAVLLVGMFMLQGCAWVQSLRRDIDEDDGNNKLSVADFDYYKDPANRNVPPPPANVMNDIKAAALAGTPVDLSGTRAKRIRTTAAEFFADNAKNENSLWADDGQTNYLFARNKLKQPGDLVTVVIEDNLRRDMVDSVKRLLPPDYRDQDIIVPGLTKNKPADDKTAAGAPAPTPTPAADGEIAPEDILTAEVLERFPNGNVRIRGVKRVPFKTSVRNIEVVAICKGNDISETDMVKSSKFFDQRVELYR